MEPPGFAREWLRGGERVYYTGRFNRHLALLGYLSLALIALDVVLVLYLHVFCVAILIGPFVLVPGLTWRGFGHRRSLILVTGERVLVSGPLGPQEIGCADARAVTIWVSYLGGVFGYGTVTFGDGTRLGGVERPHDLAAAIDESCTADAASH